MCGLSANVTILPLAEGIIFFCLREPEIVAKVGNSGFWEYQKRFWNLFLGEAAPWARDNIFWGIAVLIIPPIVAVIRNRSASLDWEMVKLTLWLYLIALVIYLLVHFIRTPWKLDQKWATEVECLKTERDKYAAKSKEIEDAKPRIVLREPNAIHVAPDVGIGPVVSGFLHPTRTVPFIKVRFVNRPKGNYPNSVARGVNARVRIFDLSGQLQVDMAGRWDDTTQPSHIPFGVSKTELPSVDFGIEQEHGLDIAYQDTDGLFVAWNNDNYDYPDARPPNHVLTGKEFVVEVKLSAAWVDETFKFQFAAAAGHSRGIIISTSPAIQAKT